MTNYSSLWSSNTNISLTCPNCNEELLSEKCELCLYKDPASLKMTRKRKGLSHMSSYS